MSLSVVRHLLLLVLVALASALPGGAAHGHAQLLSSEPPDGAILADSPATVRLRFNEPVAIGRLVLVVADGAVLDLAGRSHGDTVQASLPTTLRTGTHVVSYRVVSADGHPVGGSIGFSIGAPTTRPHGDAVSRAFLPVAIVTLRTVLLALLAVAVGGVAFLAILPAGVAGGAARRPVLIAASAVPPVVLVALALQGADVLGAGPAGAVGLPALRAGFETSFGSAAVMLAAAGLAAAGSLAATSCVVSRASAAIAVGACAGAFAASGHAASAPPWPVMPIVVAVHALVALFWLGSLIPLARLVADPSLAPSRVIRRFSAVAMPAVAVLVATGAGLAVVQIETPAAMLATDYGRLALAKLGLVGGLLAVAAWNRLVLTPRLADGRAGARAGLGRTIGLEMVLGVALLAVVAGWRSTPPPRALHAADRAGVSLHIHTAAAMTDLTIRPGRPGPNALVFSLMAGDFGPLAAKEVLVRLQPEPATIEPVERPARRGPDGLWRIADIPVPLAGRWSVRLDVLVGDFEKTVLEGVVEVRR